MAGTILGPINGRTGVSLVTATSEVIFPAMETATSQVEERAILSAVVTVGAVIGRIGSA
jgi:hypothetical protein